MNQRPLIHCFLFTSLFFLAISCEKKMKWAFPEVEQEILSVEGIVTNENKQHYIRLSLVRSEPNAASIPVSQAIVRVRFADIEHEFTEDSIQKGTYYSQNQFITPTGTPVLLLINYNSKNYSAIDNASPITPAKKAVFKMANDNMYRLQTSKEVFSSTEPAFWEFYIDWSFLDEYKTKPTDSCRAIFYVYNINNIDVSQIFSPYKEVLEFPKGSKVTQTKYSLSSEHAKFRRSLLLETEWRGGPFDVAPGNIYSNVSNNAVGFFGACNVLKENYILE
jgi:hypothetical protein